MALSQHSNVTDELLSAYIDGAVTSAERALVEDAAASDQAVAWRLDSLRQTVTLLGQLSDVPLPRSFTLNEAMLAGSTLPAESKPPATVPQPTGDLSLRERWRQFWQVGNPMLRNAAAVCAVLLVLLLVGESWVASTPPRESEALTQPVAPMAEAVQEDMTVAGSVPADSQRMGAVDAVEASLVSAPDLSVTNAEEAVEQDPGLDQAARVASVPQPATAADVAASEPAPLSAAMAEPEAAFSEGAADVPEAEGEADVAQPLLAAAMIAPESAPDSVTDSAPELATESADITEAQDLEESTEEKSDSADDEAGALAVAIIEGDESAEVAEVTPMPATAENQAQANNVATDSTATPAAVAVVKSTPRSAMADQNESVMPANTVVEHADASLGATQLPANDVESVQPATINWLQWSMAGLLLLFVVLWLRSRSRKRDPS